MSSVPLRRHVKSALMRVLRMPYSVHGVPGALCRHLPAGPVRLVDGGGWRGDFTRAMDEHFGVSRGLIVEAQPARAAALAREFLPPRFTVAACALADHTGETELEINEFDATSSILPARRESGGHAGVGIALRERVRVPLRRLDDVAHEAGMEGCDLMKLDVQGAELLVLAAATEMLARTRFVWVEVSFKPLYEGSCVFADVQPALERHGFRLLELEPGHRSPDGELWQADALFGRR